MQEWQIRDGQLFIVRVGDPGTTACTRRSAWVGSTSSQASSQRDGHDQIAAYRAGLVDQHRAASSWGSSVTWQWGSRGPVDQGTGWPGHLWAISRGSIGITQAAQDHRRWAVGYAQTTGTDGNESHPLISDHSPPGGVRAPAPGGQIRAATADDVPPDAPPNACRSRDSVGHDGTPTKARRTGIPAGHTACGAGGAEGVGFEPTRTGIPP
jgi:hypothetical protein